MAEAESVKAETSRFVATVDLGGTNLRAAIVDTAGRITRRVKHPTPQRATDPRQIVEAIVRAIRECAQSQDNVERAAILVPGTIDPGGVVLVGHNGRIVKKQAYGYSVLYSGYDATTNTGILLPPDQQVPTRTDTIYDLASLSKLFTGLVAVKLMDLHRLDPDAFVVQYLPAFASHGKSDITVTQLLMHSSGLAADPQAAVVQLVQDQLLPLLRRPLSDLEPRRATNSRFVCELNRSFVLGLFTFLWFFIVPIPGLLVFTPTSGYRLMIPLTSVLAFASSFLGLALVGYCASAVALRTSETAASASLGAVMRTSPVLQTRRKLSPSREK